jgi:hypothetical protein
MSVKTCLWTVRLLFAAFTPFMLSCQDDAPTPTASIKIEFDNIAGDQNLVLNGTRYYNQSGEDFLITKFNYFVSNFKLYKTDGSVYTVPQDSSYFLIREDLKASQVITLKNIPHGDYDHVEFMVGVDSLRNTMPESKRTGVLDPGGDMGGDGMYWVWNSGYIFMKVEGTSPFGNPANDKFYYHIGLYGGMTDRTPNNTRTVKLKFGTDIATVNSTNTPQVHLFADVLKFFDGPGTQLRITDHAAIMGSPNHWSTTRLLADNYQQMFTYDHTH